MAEPIQVDASVLDLESYDLPGLRVLADLTTCAPASSRAGGLHRFLIWLMSPRIQGVQ